MKTISTARLLELVNQAVSEAWPIEKLRDQVEAIHSVAVADEIAQRLYWEIQDGCDPLACKPLFIPLRKEYFEAFERGDKDRELRIYGPRWNERTCKPGRYVILSCGYGKHRRLIGRITHFNNFQAELMAKELRPVFGDVTGKRIAVIHIDVMAALPGSKA